VEPLFEEIEQLTNFFEKYVEIDYKGCWIWLGSNNGKGYGHLTNPSRRIHVMSHRLSWMFFRGQIPDELKVLHKCDNRLCVRPNHLFLGTQLDNMKDCISKGRKEVGEDNARSKLTESQVLEIRYLYSEGLSRREISKIFDVLPNQIRLIVKNLRWKHLITLFDNSYKSSEPVGN
jgi:hypothetical protein